MLEMEEVVDDNTKRADGLDRMEEWMEEMAPLMIYSFISVIHLTEFYFCEFLNIQRLRVINRI